VGANVSDQIKEQPLHDRTTKVEPFRSREIPPSQQENRVKVPHRANIGAALTKACRSKASIERASAKATLIEASLTALQQTSLCSMAQIARLESRNRFLTLEAPRDCYRLRRSLLRFPELDGPTGANEIVHRDVKRVVHHAIELAKVPRIHGTSDISSDRNATENKSFLYAARFVLGIVRLVSGSALPIGFLVA
jgi:hypothetical protein